jgi:phosphatidylglycerol---prolipoprotein diacylglyceryl transferase
MRPILFEITLPLVGELSFPTYLTMMTLGFVAGVWLLRRWGERDGLPGHRLVDLGFVMLLAGLVGARLFAVLTTGQLQDFIHLCTDPQRVRAPDALVSRCIADAQCGYDYLCDTARGVCYPPRDCLAALKFWQPGLVFYGGVLGAIPAGYWFARKKGLDPLQVADLAAPALMLGQVFGRLGCFFQGCCYGAATDAWMGVGFPGHAHDRHPSQLYEAAAVLALFVVLRYAIAPRKRGHGEVLGWMLVLYGAARSILELVRDDPRGALGPLSTSQIISIPLVAVGLWLIHSRRRPKSGSLSR